MARPPQPSAGAAAIVGEQQQQQRLTPRLRTKPSSNKLRSTTVRSTIVPSTSSLLQPPVFNRSRTDLSVPRTTNPNNAPVEMDTSIFTRKVRQPSGSSLPTPAERSTTPIIRAKSGPPTKDHRVFSLESSIAGPPSVGSSGASSDKGSESESRTRRIIRKKGSAVSSSSGAYTHRQVTANASSSSLSTSASYGSRNASQTSVLGITLPATSASSQQLLSSTRERAGSVPRLITQDLPTPLDTSGAACESSSPSTRYTDSPFSRSSSTPTSASSAHSPGPAAMLRTVSSSPKRPPVTRNRSSSLASVSSDIGLDTVRESTTSSSSASTVRAHIRSRSNSKSSDAATPRSPPTISTTSRPSISRTPKLDLSPSLLPSKRVPSPAIGNGGVRIPRGTPSPGPGLGVSIPGTMTTGGTAVLRTRSRSISSPIVQQRARKDAATPPLPSPGVANRGTTSRIAAPAPPTSKPATPVPSSIVKPGFFSRSRTKSEDKPTEKLVKRGPAAGTGYEGYGSFGKSSRSRSGSTSNSTTRGRSGSQTSVTSANRSGSGSRPASRASVEMDEYFVERLKPVVIVGGEVVENQNRAAEMVRSGSSPAVMESRPESRQGIKQEPTRSGSSLGVFGRGTGGRGAAKESVAIRRANSPGRSETPIPTPINVSGHRIQPASSPVSSVGSPRKPSLEVPNSALPTPATGKTKTKRWNFFQKSQPKASPVAPTQPFPSAPPAPLVARSASRRNIPPHYAILDQDEQREAQELVERMHELRQKRGNTHDIPVPSMNVPRNVNQARKSALPTSASLAQSQNDRLRQPTASEQPGPLSAPLQQTFSKPRLPLLTTELSRPSDQGRSAPPRMGRVVNEMFQASPSQPEFQVNWNWSGLTPTDATSGAEKTKQLMEYDPLDVTGRRKGSVAAPVEDDTPISTTSDWPARSDSISTPAVSEAPFFYDEEPQAAAHMVEEVHHDEFYSELECLYGIKTQPPTPAVLTFAAATSLRRSNTLLSTASSLGEPFQYSSPLEVKVDITFPEEEEDQIKTPDSPTLPPLLPAKSIPDSIPIISHPDPIGPDQPLPYTPPAQGILSPSTPFSITSFIRYYGESDPQRANISEPLMHQLDGPEQKRAHKSRPSDGSTYTTSSGGSVAIVDDEMKIRPWALIASRWLSFDRVLVSPAHQALSGATGGRVLVVDGLGTDDWSFYCALSYPNAKVYNLSQSPVSKTPASPSVPRPANHHQIHYPSFATSFPFPKGFFNVICFRFLPSSSDGHWPFILSECKRVLQPGGYLETTLLDADMTNVGARTQRAVDLVKAIMQRENESCCSNTKPASERVLRILAKRGFEDISKCFLGLPAVGKVDSRSEMEHGEREPSPDDPEAIGEVVSKVGRWWYTRCYEGVITAQGEHMERSMWADKGLLRECKKKKTNFRMLVCYARKPLSKKASE